MYIFYGILLILFTIQPIPLSAMDHSMVTAQELSPEQSDFITAINLYRECPHRLSFTKLETYDDQVNTLFNKNIYPYHHKHLHKELAEINIDKSITILSTPNKKKIFDKKSCITEICRLAIKINTLKKKPLLYCIEQVTMCEPQCLQYLQDDRDFINQTKDSLLTLVHYNPQFALTIDLFADLSIQQLNDSITCNFINVSDNTLLLAPKNNVLDALDSYKITINNLCPFDSHKKRNILSTLQSAYTNYDRINKKITTMKNVYKSCLIIIKNSTAVDATYRRCLTVLVAAERNGTLALCPDLYQQFIALQ